MPIPVEVIVHPIVLLSVVDHYNRMAKGTKKRVVGCLLGEYSRGKLDITNIFGIPFDEDQNNPDIWFLDHVYHETMFHMFKKVNVAEKIVGWYTSGPKLRVNDIQINDIFKNYIEDPVLVVVDVNMTQRIGIPTQAYAAIQQVNENGELENVFKHITCSIGAHEVESVGVEHLIRDIKDVFTGTLGMQIMNKLDSIKALILKLKEIEEYLNLVTEGKYPLNNQIIFNLQEIFNYLPNLSVDTVVKSFAVKTNDMLVTTYICSVCRTVMALHKLINNKIQNKVKIKEQIAENAAKIQQKKEKEKEETEAIQEKKESKASKQL